MGHNLVLPRSPLLGRGETLVQVQQLILQADVGLLTLTGPGGIGKSRLALQAAANLLDHYVDGVCFVALAAIVDPALALPAIAQMLGMRTDPAQPVQARLAEHLCDRQLLLVLDNFEHVLPAALDVAALLHACPRLKVLATSRAPLHIYGEHVFPVPPLALPDPATLTHLSEAKPDLQPYLQSDLRGFAAVDLFCQRAAAAQPGFAFTPANALAVAQICIGLDGLPLAIELAAARITFFGPSILAARLQERLVLLTHGPQDLPPRQRTLRDEIAWSYDLLQPHEQQLFRRLAVFSGGFTLPAAESIGGTAGIQGTDVLDSLAALVDHSLLRQLEQAGGEPRLGMLETIREYALEQLARSGEAELVRSCHAHYFVAFAEAMERELGETNAKQRVCARLHADFENMRAAVAWCIQPQQAESVRAGRSAAHPPGGAAAGDMVELALRLAGALSWFGLVGERLNDVSRLLETALQPAGGSTLVRAKALWGAGTVAMFLGSYATARAHLAASIDLFRSASDLRGLALALREACSAAYAQRDLAAAQQYGEECVVLFCAAGNQGDAAVAYDNLGATFAAQGNLAAARAAFEKEHAISLAHGYKSTLGLARMGQGWVAGLGGLYPTASAHLDKALALFRELQESWTCAAALHLWGEVAQCSGDLPHAGRCFRESLLLAHQLGDRAAVALVIQQVGALAFARGQAEDAARLFAVAASHHLAGGAIFYTLAGPAERSQSIAQVRTALGDELFAACWAQGQDMALPQAVAQAATLAGAAAEEAPATREQDTPKIVQLQGSPDHLTTREREVLQLLVQGLTYGEIADKLVISPRTVNAHLTTIYGKLDVSSRRAAVRVALEHRLLDAR